VLEIGAVDAVVVVVIVVAVVVVSAAEAVVVGAVVVGGEEGSGVRKSVRIEIRVGMHPVGHVAGELLEVEGGELLGGGGLLERFHILAGSRVVVVRYSSHRFL